MRALTSLLLLLILELAPLPALADGPQALFLVKGSHGSNLFKRPPEPTNDRIAIGVTVEIGNFEVDFTHGKTTRDCAHIRTCDWRASTEIEGRWYPFKGRNR